MPKTFIHILFACSLIFLYTLANDAHAQIPLLDAVTQSSESSENSKDGENGDASSEEASDEEKAENKPEEENPFDLSVEKVIDSNSITGRWKKQFSQFLEKYDLNGSLVGKAIASLGISALLMFMYFLVKQLNKVISKKLLSTKYFNYHNQQRIKKYTKTFSWFAFALGVIFAFIGFITVWNDNPEKIFSTNAFTFTVQSVFSVFFIIFVGLVILDVLNNILNLFFKKIDNHSSRVNTLFPIIKNTVYFTVFLLLGLTLISELGINIYPLLAGAGVIGFAIGFGAQALVKDIITGFIIIIEDLFQVGDVVQLGDSTGLVERVTIRKVQLRDLGGIVYTIPFGEISVVKNFTKEFSFYLMDIGISYREDTDEVIELLHEISKEMREDEDFKDLMLEDIEIFGVDQFADSAVIIKARIKTPPIQQWTVGREFNRRMKYAFDKHGIEIPFPHQTLYFGEDKKGNAPPANLKVIQMQKETLEEYTQANDDSAEESANTTDKTESNKQISRNNNVGESTTDSAEDE